MSAAIAISSENSRRIRRASVWLENRAPAEEVVMVGASLDAANELTRNVVKYRGAAFGWHRLTLSQLAASVAASELANKGLTPVSRIATDAIVARFLHNLKADGRLGRFQPIAETPGFPRSIARVITELRLADVSPEKISAAAPDIALLIEVYEAELQKAGLIDWPGTLMLATEVIRSSGSASRLVGLPTLLLDVPVANNVELAFVRAFVSAAPEVLATIPAADEFSINRTCEALKVQAEDLDHEHEDEGALGPIGTLANLQRQLFHEQQAQQDVTHDGAVEVFSAPGEGRECIEIARRILSIARGGLPFDRIAVLLRSPEHYRANLAEAFGRAGIPTHFVRGTTRPDPSARAFCALLKCADEGLSASRFAEYLSLGQVPDAGPDGAPPQAIPSNERWVAPDPEAVAPVPIMEIDDPVEFPKAAAPGTELFVQQPVADGRLRAPGRWERLLVEAAVIGGRNRWRRRIDGLGADLRRKLLDAGREDEAREAMFARMLEDLTSFSAYALPLIDTLADLPSAANWGDWIEQLGALATRAVKQPDRVLAILAELAPMAPVGPVALSEVLLVLEDLLLEVSVPPASPRYGKVFVGPPDAARGLSFEAVFVPGLAEKMFPGKIVEEPILLDVVRGMIDSSLATNQTRLATERLALALAVGAADRTICFSYPRVDLDQARSRVPSFYALEAVRAAEGLLPDFAGLAKRAETAIVTRLGWPAPPDAADAIDDAEHDLAVLGRLVTQPQAEASAARYLMTVNSYLARSLRSRYQRWGSSWTPADGLISRTENIRTLMARHGLAVRSYSPTALQTFARCPYKFFLQTIQGLSPREVPEAIDQMDPLQRGSLIHDVQFQLLAQLRQESLLPVRAANLERVQEALELVISAVAVRYHDDLNPAIERVWEDGISAIRADLREWLRLASEDESGYVPANFELTFGMERPDWNRVDPQAERGAIHLESGVQLRGSIDLVEQHPTGIARVTDHKTGAMDSTPNQLIGGGKSLQPLFYALAAEKLLAGRSQVRSGRLYFCTSIGGFSEHVVTLNDEARAAAVQVVETIDAAVTAPFLPAAPDQRECEYCSYRPVCGPYEERRVTRKSQQRLEQLFALRESR
ncbi:PD-(D/E)XK nuclease family protein [Bradyrhizobium lablabi]|nr:PD-(D/E)XK nuclease family protein [Bradyrhizobium lablabi]